MGVGRSPPVAMTEKRRADQQIRGEGQHTL